MEIMVAYFCHHLSDNYFDYFFMLTCQLFMSTCQKKYHHNLLLNILFLYRVYATNRHLLVSLMSDKSTLLSDKSTKNLTNRYNY